MKADYAPPMGRRNQKLDGAQAPEHPLSLEEIATGRRIRAARMAGARTQKAWEAASGVPQTTLSEWERGLSLSTFLRIATALRSIGLDPRDVLFSESSVPDVPDDPLLDVILEHWSRLPPKKRQQLADAARGAVALADLGVDAT
jgi:transcriptional regulator with XRE-family HTH domain